MSGLLEGEYCSLAPDQEVSFMMQIILCTTKPRQIGLCKAWIAVRTEHSSERVQQKPGKGQVWLTSTSNRQKIVLPETAAALA